jgi:ABC-2 type transport system permease protein
MSGSFISVARFVAWRNLRVLVRRPALFAPTLLMPLLFLVAFAGALSRIAKLPEFGSIDYTAFQYVYALMQAAAFAGAIGGTAMTDDVVNGFMDRLMVTAPNRAGIVFGYVIAMFIRGLVAALVLTGAAFLLGMNVDGGPLDILGLVGLAALVNLTASLWSTGIAMHIRNINATALEILPIFLALFLTPVFLPLHLLHGWFHTVARVNPFTRPIEAGRSLIDGTPANVALAFIVMGGITVLAALFAVWGVRRGAAPASGGGACRRGRHEAAATA